jgi:hypothetical protein
MAPDDCTHTHTMSVNTAIQATGISFLNSAGTMLSSISNNLMMKPNDIAFLV